MVIDKGYPLHESVRSLLQEMYEFHVPDQSKEKWCTRINDILAHDRDARRGERCIALVREVIYHFSEHGTDEPINGADAVDFLMEWITKAKKALI